VDSDHSAAVLCPSNKIQFTVQKETQVVAARAGMTADQLRAVFGAPPLTAGGLPIGVPSPEVIGPSDEA
jgi:hypothetical protein